MDWPKSGRTGGRVPAGASGDADLHRGLCPYHRSCATGAPQPLPALFQPAPRVPEVSGLEARHQLPLLWAPGIQLLLQHALRVSLLPHAGGGLLPWPHGRLRLHVSLRGHPHDPAGAPGQPVLLGPGPHCHAGVCLESPQPQSEGQLLWPPHLPGTIPALGTHGFLTAAGQLNPCRPAGDCCGPHLLLPRGCFPQPAWRQEVAADPQFPEAATGCPRGGPQLPAPPGGAARTPAAMTLPRARASPRSPFSWSLTDLPPTPNSRFQESNLSCRLGLCPGPTQINRMTCTSSSTALAPCLSWPHLSMLLALTYSH